MGAFGREAFEESGNLLRGVRAWREASLARGARVGGGNDSQGGLSGEGNVGEAEGDFQGASKLGGCALLHAGAVIEKDQDGNRLFSDALLDVECVVACEDVPIQSAQIISRSVGSKILPFEAASGCSTRSFAGAVPPVGTNRLESDRSQLPAERRGNRRRWIVSLS